MLYVFLVLLLLWFVISLFPWCPLGKPKLKPSKLSVFYGAPGSGKSSMAAFWADRYRRAGYSVFSNFPIDGCYALDRADIGHWKIPGPALVIIDEAGLDYNNRNFKRNFDEQSLEWWKKHRHELCECMIFSQGFDDMDKKLRTLATDMFIVKRLGRFVISRSIRKKCDIDELTKQPIDAYFFKPFGSKWIWGPSVWGSFDSFEPMDLPPKEYKLYNHRFCDDLLLDSESDSVV